MKFCTDCGTRVNEDFKFCGECGKNLTAIQKVVNAKVAVSKVEKPKAAVTKEETASVTIPEEKTVRFDAKPDTSKIRTEEQVREVISQGLFDIGPHAKKRCAENGIYNLREKMMHFYPDDVTVEETVTSIGARAWCVDEEYSETLALRIIIGPHNKHDDMLFVISAYMLDKRLEHTGAFNKKYEKVYCFN